MPQRCISRTDSRSISNCFYTMKPASPEAAYSGTSILPDVDSPSRQACTGPPHASMQAMHFVTLTRE